MSKNKNNEFCYLALSDDILSKSNIELIRKSSRYGKVIIGLMSDYAINEYKSAPLLNFKQRKLIAENLKNVHFVVEQKTRDYTENLIKYKPKYVIHKKNFWRKGHQKKIRDKIIKLISKWSGKLLEFSINSENENSIFQINPDLRRNKLIRLINSKKIVRLLESHSSLSALIIEKLKLNTNGATEEFDGLWCSSLADSALRAKPDNQSVDLTTRVNSLNDIMETSTKPIMFDADNGGSLEQLPYVVKNLERLSVSAMVMEDKTGSKRNSLFDDQSGSKQDSMNNFCKKLKLAAKSRVTKDLLIIARIESFILNKGLNDALKRAEAYSRAGADLILIHSKAKTAKEIFSFSKSFQKSKYFKPLVCVPSTYSNTHENDLIKNGFKVVIYANHLLRSIYPAMLKTAKSILKNKKSRNIENTISPVKEIINLIKQND